MRTGVLALLLVACHAGDPVDDAVRGQMDKQALVGVGVGIARGSDIVYAKGFGFEDKEAQIPVDPDITMFRWASVTKTLTAAVALQLAREGKLDLDADITTIWPDYVVPYQWMDQQRVMHTLEDADRHITSRQLLAHLAGLEHYDNGAESPVPEGINDPAINTGLEWAVRAVMDHPLVNIPGERHSYSSLGYDLLGVVMEHATGQTFARLAEERVLMPLGLTSVRVDYEWVNIPHRAKGYLDGVDTGSDDVSWKLPGGGFISTLRDFTTYCSAFGGTALLDPGTKQEAWQTQHTKDGTPTGYGLGFGIGEYKQRHYIAHNGTQQKAKTFLRYYPDEDLCIVVMSNSEQADPNEVALAVEDAFRTSP